MHFENGLSQQQIASLLGYSKMTVSRLLQKAKDKNVVRTQVMLPFDCNKKTENKLETLFGLDRAWVIRRKSETEDIAVIRDELAQAAAFFLNTEPMADVTIGVGIGRTIGSVVRNLVPLKTKGVHVVQLMGGLPEVTNENPFSIIQETCGKWEATGTFLTSFAAVEDRDSRDKFLRTTEFGRMIYDLWERCDMAIFGIGSIDNGTLLSPQLVGEEELKTLKECGANGDVLGHCFNEDGDFVQSVLEDRLVAIPLDTLMKIRKRRAIAVGVEKASAILGALRSGVATELVTDDVTAQRILEKAG
jgi:DNA-binding transcriptional regulator LsrR (DeoR family)